MSAGGGEYPGEPVLHIISDLSVLAPAFQHNVRAALEECHEHGLDAIVHETQRTRATALVYYRRGRSTIPPHYTVTNAPNELYSWHGFCLAADVVSKAQGWEPGDMWYKLVAAIFKKHHCDWGGAWKHPDTPHFQHGGLKASPSDRARELFRLGGLHAVWEAVGAL